MCINNPDRWYLIIDYLSMNLHQSKYCSRLILNNKRLIDSIIELIIFLEKQWIETNVHFKLKNQFAFFLNEITRILLTYPELIPWFKINRLNEKSQVMEEDFIVFSNLLRLLEIDQLIVSFEYRKYIRRSLIVCLSFDETLNSIYWEKKSYLCEILVDKLCNYYQMLPSSFDLCENTSTWEAGCNINRTFHCLVDIYFDFKDYVVFLNKICNCLREYSLRDKFKYYLFNQFFIINIQPNLLSYSQKISRSTLQYIIAMLHEVNNNEIIDVIANFLFGFNDEQTALKFTNQYLEHSAIDPIEERVGFMDRISRVSCVPELIDWTKGYNYNSHQVSKISFKILSNLSVPKEHMNIITMELFEIFIQKRPYMMIHKFIKPYVDFCLKEISKTGKFVPGPKRYPTVESLYNWWGLYQKYDVSNMKDNIEVNMQKNYSYYMNYDIDFYCYYWNERKHHEEMESKSVNENEEILMEIDDGKWLEESIRNSIDNWEIKNVSVNEKSKFAGLNSPSPIKGISKSSEESTPQTIKIEDCEENDMIILDEKLFDEVDEVEQEFKNMNYLLMKNLILRLSNYFNNPITDNIFWTNLLLTIISVPCLQFDPSLVECNALWLDEKSKYSVWIIVRYWAQEISRKIKKNTHFDSFFKRRIEELKETNEEVNDNRTNKSKKVAKPTIQAKPKIQFQGDLEKEYQKNKNELTNFIIYFEFLKEFVSTISHKYNFEGLVEDIYGFYSNLLDDYYNNSEHFSISNTNTF